MSAVRRFFGTSGWPRRVLGNLIKGILLRLGFLNIHHYTILGDPSRVIIGRNVILRNALLNTSSGRIIIGDNVVLGPSVMLITGTHDYSQTGIKRMKSFPRSGRDIVIENGAWICSGAIVLGKIKIGRNAVVSAGSLVNKDVESNTIVGGVPAKFIKKIDTHRATT